MDCLDKENKIQSPSPTVVEQYLTNLYSTLSQDIHGAPWNINAVELSDQLKAVDKCFLDKVLVRMGIKDSPALRPARTSTPQVPTKKSKARAT